MAYSKLNFKRDLYHLLGPIVRRCYKVACEIGMLTNKNREASEFNSFGNGSFISFPPGTIFGKKAIAIGEDTMIGPFVSISAGMMPNQELLFDKIVQIGSRCMIGRGSHIVGHMHVEIDDDVITGPYVYITDQNHGYEDITIPIWKQYPKDKGVYIGKGSWLGTQCVILPGTYIGKNVVVAAGAVVSGEVPDFSVVAGSPAKIVKHFVDGKGWIKPT